MYEVRVYNTYQLILRRAIFLLWLLSNLFISSATTLGEIELSTLVQNADVAVVGELHNVQRRAGWGIIYASADLSIADVLFSDGHVKGKIPLDWVYIPYYEWGQDYSLHKGPNIWLLRRENGRLTTGYWQGVLDMGERAALLNEIRNPLRLRQDRSGRNSTSTVKIAYRNLTSDTLRLPAFYVNKGVLTMPKGTTFSIQMYDHMAARLIDLPPKENRLQLTDSGSIVVKPGTSYEIAVDIAQLTGITAEAYDMQLDIPGVPISNRVRVFPLIKQDYSNAGDWNPFHINLLVMLKHSPTREIIAGLGIGLISLFVLFRSRQKPLV